MPPKKLPLTVQTLYAELLERAGAEAFESTFAGEGSFVPKTIKGRKYWYFSEAHEDGRRQRYVGPETAELLARIAAHRKERGEAKDRRQLVSTLVRSGGLPQPVRTIGAVVEALAQAGAFRLRAVLIGTVAYQVYGAVLGCRLPRAQLQTLDVDVAQFAPVSMLVEDEIESNMLDVLKAADPSFRPVPTLGDPTRAHAYIADEGLRVEFLVPNRGPESGESIELPALHTDAQPFRFLDFLIRVTEPAVLLHGAGIPVEVPRAERFAVHKLMLHGLRHERSTKADKDLAQAAVLLDALVELRPEGLQEALAEARDRGARWDGLVLGGLGALDPAVRDPVLHCVGLTRAVVPGLALTFDAPAMRYDTVHAVVRFDGWAGDEPIACMISREALDDHFGADRMTPGQRVEEAMKVRPVLERMAAWKFAHWPIEEPGQVLVRTAEVEALRTESEASGPATRAARAR